MGLLAILKAGASYVPLDPTVPSERIALVLADTGALVVLVQDRSMELPKTTARVVCMQRERERIQRRPTHDPPSIVAPGNAAYVIHTSGSTMN